MEVELSDMPISMEAVVRRMCAGRHMHWRIELSSLEGAVEVTEALAVTEATPRVPLVGEAVVGAERRVQVALLGEDVLWARWALAELAVMVPAVRLAVAVTTAEGAALAELAVADPAMR
jgi:hypothetical protein